MTAIKAIETDLNAKLYACVCKYKYKENYIRNDLIKPGYGILQSGLSRLPRLISLLLETPSLAVPI
jgi:hypothetical protein